MRPYLSLRSRYYLFKKEKKVSCITKLLEMKGDKEILPIHKGCVIDHICYQIGDWYLMMKPLLEGQHNLGFMKEKLKTMICGE